MAGQPPFEAGDEGNATATVIVNDNSARTLADNGGGDCYRFSLFICRK
jgi:hypothetical protein